MTQVLEEIEIQKRNWMNNAVGLVASSDIVVASVDRCSTAPLQLQKNEQSNKVGSEAAGSYNQNSNYSNNKYSATFYKNIFSIFTTITRKRIVHLL